MYGENAPSGTGGHWRGYNPAYSCAIKAINPGQVINSPKVYQLTWTVYDALTHTYQATYASTVQSVWDEGLPLGEDYRALTAQSSIAAVQANAGSWYQTGGVVYVRLLDDRAPDANLHVFRSIQSAYCARDNITIYLEGIEFQGGPNGAAYFRNASAAGGLYVYAKDCKFKYSFAIGGFAMEGTTLSICQGCESAKNQNDGFNYHVRNTVIPDAIEIDCTGRDNGSTSDDDNNGSSIHDGGRVCRLNVIYHGNYGPNVIDINDALSYNLGCEAYGSAAPTVTMRHNFYADATMWLDSCYSHGAPSLAFDLYVPGAGDAIYHRQLWSDGKNWNGGGTIATY
jgi:hypothetical protein